MSWEETPWIWPDKTSHGPFVDLEWEGSVLFCSCVWSMCQSAEACWKNAAHNQKRCRSLASDEEPALQKSADQMEDQTTESPGAFHLSFTGFLFPSCRCKSVALLKLLHVYSVRWYWTDVFTVYASQGMPEVSIWIC